MGGLLNSLREWLCGRDCGWARESAATADTPLQSTKPWQSTVSGVIPSLDLHGLGVQEALAEVAKFLRISQQVGVPRIRIVYGKGKHSPGGRGVLREVVPKWLETEGAGYVERWERRLDQSGLDGGAEVFLRMSPPQTSQGSISEGS